MSKTAEKIGKTLANMKGKTFDYAKKIYFVEDFSVDEVEQKFTVKTNLQSFTRYFDSFDEFVRYWTEVQQVNAVVPVKTQEVATEVMDKENAVADQLIGVLMENIKKVQEHPEYIPQAQAINNNVNSITNIMKLKMGYWRESKKRMPR